MLCCCWVAGECSASSSFGLNGTLSTLQPAGHSVPLEVGYAPPVPVAQMVGSTSSLQAAAACLVSAGAIVLVHLSYLILMLVRSSLWHGVRRHKLHQHGCLRGCPNSQALAVQLVVLRLWRYLLCVLCALQGLLPPQASLDSASLAHMTRRGNRPMSRLRTVSMPRWM
jgi:hypothetical protein